ncbi:Uncharacterized protein GBIM_20788 [Gryllus bimaculatus]|nr:Uncharacterized protein GBIM_20788 [Gryllus bimaculatus]
MGCISSKTDINDIHHNIFQMNVDELGNRLNPGQLEITETDLVLHQRRKAPVKWPLRCLRRYGFDAELFSFESGRRCPTGAGIYAFRCQRAEQLFNLLQTHIQVRNNAGEDGVSRDFSVPSAPGPTVSLRGSSSGDSNYLDPAPVRTSNRTAPGNTRFTSQNGVLSTRLDSVGSSSNGPLSPQGTASPSPPPPVPVPNAAIISSVSSSNPSVLYANEELFSTSTTATDPSENNNKEFLRQSLPSSVTISLSNESSVREKPVSRLSVCSGDGLALTGLSDPCAMASYVNVDLSNGPLSPSCSVDEDSNYAQVEVSGGETPVYMNLIPGPENGRLPTPDIPVPLRVKSNLSPCGMLLSTPDWEIEESKRCYANLQPGEIEVPCNISAKHLVGNERLLPPKSSLSPNQSLQLVVSPVNMQRQVNYIVLDLEQSKGDTGGVSPQQFQPPTSPVGSLSLSVLPLPSESPQRISEGYATIDFNKTVALSHSVNPNMVNDTEGSRKTRHNSTISDLQTRPIRHSSSD